MDVSYLLQALRYYAHFAKEYGPEVPGGYRDALQWMIEYVEANYDELDDMLEEDLERLNEALADWEDPKQLPGASSREAAGDYLADAARAYRDLLANGDPGAIGK